MNNFFNKKGRYGADALTGALFAAAFIFMIIADRFRIRIFILPAYGLAIWAVGRIFSKNIFKRQNENTEFMDFLRRTKDMVIYKIDEFKQQRTHRFYKCPKCGAKLRIPRGKGEIVISCPKCANKFSARS